MLEWASSLTLWMSGAFTVWCWTGGWERICRWVRSKRQNLTYYEIIVQEEWAHPFASPRFSAFRYRLGDIKAMVDTLERMKATNRTWVWHTEKGLYVNIALDPNITFDVPAGMRVEDDDS